MYSGLRKAIWSLWIGIDRKGNQRILKVSTIKVYFQGIVRPVKLVHQREALIISWEGASRHHRNVIAKGKTLKPKISPIESRFFQQEGTASNNLKTYLEGYLRSCEQ